ncbi:MAG: hypothetical protein ACKVU1_14875 [bacterium]
MRCTRDAARAFTIAAILAAPGFFAGCADSDVDGPGASDRFDVGILVIAGNAGRAGWPDGDAIRVSVVHDGAPIGDAIVTANGATLTDRGDFYELPPPFELQPFESLAFAVRLPSFAQRDTLLVPERPRILGPLENADLTGCGSIEIEWSRFTGAGGAWVVVDGAGGETAAFGSRDAQGSLAIIPVPRLSSNDASISVLALSAPVDSFRPDAPLRRVIPAGVHRLAWSTPRAVRLDPASPLETNTPDSLTTWFESGDSVRIAWSPDSVRVRRLSISTQFFAEGNLRWEIVSPEGFLPPVTFARVPDGARACAPLARTPAPIEAGVEYLIELTGAGHTGRGRGVPLR